MPTVLNVRRRARPALRTACLAAALAAALPAYAELTNGGLIGPGARWRPAYDGSSSQRLEPVPVLRYFGQPWFARSTQGVLEGGARMELAPGLYLGAQLAYEPGRKARESALLRNRSGFDIDRGASIGAQLEWDHKFGRVPITLLARARQHTDTDRGAQADLRLSVGIFEHGRVSAGVFGQAIWASDKSMQSLYGITPQQSAAGGLPAYQAGGGLLASSGGLLWSVDLTQSWALVGSVEARHLHGDAAGSPLAERSWNHYISAGVAHRF